MRKPFMVTITGPSCSGKTTLLDILTTPSARFAKLPSVTTRAKRTGEIEGEEYFFVDETEFRELADAGELVQSTCYKGVMYGTRRSDLTALLDNRRVPVRVVEPSGVESFSAAGEAMGFDVVKVFISEEPEVLLERWLERVADSARFGLPVNNTFFTHRILATLNEEQRWIGRQNYDLFLVSDHTRRAELVFGLQRIAKGLLDINMARRLFPRPRDGAGRKAA